jgi:hypothetical protein
MYQAVYYHKTIIGYELMLRDIFKTIYECCDSSILDISNIKSLVYEGNIAYWDDEWVFNMLYNYLYSPDSPSYLKQKIKNFLDRRGPKVVYEEIIYGNSNISEKFNKIRDTLQKTQIPSNSIYPIEEKINIVNKNRIKILSNNKEISINEFKSTLIFNMPTILTIRRIYVDYEYAKRAREVIK